MFVYGNIILTLLALCKKTYSSNPSLFATLLHVWFWAFMAIRHHFWVMESFRCIAVLPTFWKSLVSPFSKLSNNSDSTVHYFGAEKQPVQSGTKGLCFSTFSSISLNAEQRMCTINNSKSHWEVILLQRKMYRFPECQQCSHIVPSHQKEINFNSIVRSHTSGNEVTVFWDDPVVWHISTNVSEESAAAIIRAGK